MIEIRKSADRGRGDHGWLSSRHTFSFAGYQDPEFMGFGKLRVINEDIVEAAKGFDTHQHRDMEIISYVIKGEMAHRDSLGTGSTIKRGEIQRMSAGSGVQHSEFNQSKTDLLHFLQIWIIPNQANLPPSYEQKEIPIEKNKLILIGTNESSTNAVMIHQDAKLFVAYLDKHSTLEYSINPYRRVWVQLIAGEIKINNQQLNAGDGAAILAENHLAITCTDDAEFLLFDLAE